MKKEERLASFDGGPRAFAALTRRQTLHSKRARAGGRAGAPLNEAHHHPCPPACAKSMFPTNPTLAMALPLQDFKSLKKWFLDKHDLKLDEPFDDNSGLSHLHRAVLHVPKYQNEAREIIKKVRA